MVSGIIAGFVLAVRLYSKTQESDTRRRRKSDNESSNRLPTMKNPILQPTGDKACDIRAQAKQAQKISILRSGNAKNKKTNKKTKFQAALDGWYAPCTFGFRS